MWKEFFYIPRNTKKENNLDIRVFLNPFDEEILNKSGSKFSPDDGLRNLQLWGVIPGGDKYFFVETNLLPDDIMSQTLDRPGVPHIEMVYITRLSTSVSSMINDGPHTLKIYEDKLGEDESKRTHCN